MLTLTFLSTLAFLTLTLAQNATVTNSTTAASDYGLNPNSVDLSTRQYWCQQQQAECPLICADINHNDSSTIQNTCDANSLSYQCVCGNNQAPNATQYTQTIPYFECTTAGDQCVAACAQGDTACQTNCRTSRQCGATDPKHYNLTTATTAAASSAAPTGATVNGGGTGAASTRFRPEAGYLVLFGGVVFGFAILL